MKKVLCVASVWMHLQNFHIPYIREMQNAMGCEVHLAANGIPENLPFDNIHPLPIKKSLFAFSNIKAVAAITSLLRREKFDLIYVHTTLAACLIRIAVWLSRVKNTRLIYVCHGYFFKVGAQGAVSRSPRSILYLAVEKLLAPVTDMLVVMNREDYASARRHALCRHIYFGHGMGLVPEKHGDVSQQNLSHPVAVFLCVGELSARKNQAQLISAFAKAAQQLPVSELWLAGDGSKRQYCEHLAQKLNIGDKVRFFGHVDNISQLYAAADILVTTSRCEGLPFCVMEALHHGLPVIASNIKGHRDLLVDSRNGLLYNLDDDQSLVEALVRLGSSAEERARLANNALLPPQYYIAAAMREFYEYSGGFLPVRDTWEAEPKKTLLPPCG